MNYLGSSEAIVANKESLSIESPYGPLKLKEGFVIGSDSLVIASDGGKGGVKIGSLNVGKKRGKGGVVYSLKVLIEK